jgi:hypothetical protein
MGADFSAIAVIGCIVYPDKIPTVTKKVKAFEHDIPEDSDVKFDAKTGKPLWKQEKYPEYTFDEDRDPRVKEIDKKGLKLWCGTEGKPTILGFGIGDTYSNGGASYDFTALPNVNEVKEKLKSILEPLSMWDEKAFGLYSLLYCSC